MRLASDKGPHGLSHDIDLGTHHNLPVTHAPDYR